MRAVVFVVHLLLITLAWLSPLWVDWKLILFGVCLLSLQYVIVGGCLLTFIETGKDTYQTFYYHHLVKFFPTLNKRYVFYVVRYLVPLCLVLLGWLLQEQYGVIPWVSFF